MRLNYLFCIPFLLLTACSHESRESRVIEKKDINAEIISHHLAIKVDNKGQLDNQDLTAFAKKIENVRILALGEQTHGAGTVFSLKTDLIKYLHQHHDFDLFILESGMYDVREIYQAAKSGQSIKTMAPGNIFYMYANSEEVTPLFDYVNNQINTDNPLIMVGFDSQHTGGFSLDGLVADLTKAQQAINKASVETLEWQVFSQQIQQVLDGSTVRFPLAQEVLFFKHLKTLASDFSEHDNGFWSRISTGLVAQAKRQWNISDNRSQEMGGNIKWWAEKYPDKKIIVWAHTWHLTKKGNDQVNAGKVVSDAFGDEYYMVHFTGEKGQYLSYLDLQNKDVTQPKVNSIEHLFSQKTHTAINYVENKSLNLEGVNMEAFGNDYESTLPASEWSTYWDAMFVLKEITPATYQQ